MKRFVLFLLIAIISQCIDLRAETISLKPGCFDIVIEGQQPKAVHTALKNLVRDFDSVLGFKPKIVETSGESSSIIVINEEVNGHPHWMRELDGFESHRVYVEKGNIYLCGKDMRGTIYAIYTFSEMILGIPPFWYFYHWKPTVKDNISIDSDLDIFYKSPDVLFRAIFPNDQDMIIPWRRLSDDNFNSWLECMMRMKFNTLELQETIDYSTGKLTSFLDRCSAHGLIISSTHAVMLNTAFWRWGKYWEKVYNKSAPKLAIKDSVELKKFWRHAAGIVASSDIENIWQISFRGAGDCPFWASFEGSPKKDEDRARIINEMLKSQVDIIHEVSGQKDPWIRLTLYDEMSDLMGKGLLKLPEGERIIWNYSSARRDHFPKKDIQEFDCNQHNVKLGYYFNFQFTSTGCHLVAGESPWKMETNYRYVNSKGDFVFSVVNVGNIREFVFEMAANASLLWDMDNYNSDLFILNYCKYLYGPEYAEEIAGLFHDYYYSFWQQKESTFPGMDRQYFFQDNRYSRAFEHIGQKYLTYTTRPLHEDGFETEPYHTFRIEDKNQVSAIIKAMKPTAEKFDNVAARCDALIKKLPSDKQKCFRDMLCVPSHFMADISWSLYWFVVSYQNQAERLEPLETSIIYYRKAMLDLYQIQEDHLLKWYDGEKYFGLKRRLQMLEDLKKKIVFNN